MILKVQRKPTEAGVELQFNYDNPGLEFLVKNFSNGDIYVGFEPGGGVKVAWLLSHQKQLRLYQV